MIQSIINKVKGFDYVSFDVFDTLIFRNVQKPADLFCYVNRQAEKKAVHIENFTAKRIAAEARAIECNKDSDEISLDGIYKQIPFVSEKDREFVKELEMNLEIDFCTINPEIHEVWKFCKNNGKKIIITSDMYLPRQTIEAMLTKCGYSFDFVFISSEIGVRKSSGKLFKHIAETLGIKPSQIIHIGDNKRSDFLMPKISGCKSVLYTRRNSCFAPQKCANANSCDSRTIYAIKNNSTLMRDDFLSVGINTLGPLLVGFCQWIVGACKQKKLNKILFFARDGFIVQKAFKILYPELDSHYVAISRRSVTVPQLVNAESMADIIRIIPYIKRKESWVTFMHKLGIDEDHPIVGHLIKKYGENFSKDQLLNDSKYSSVFNEIIQVVKDNATQEMLEAKKYLDQYFDEDIAIVDIGWYGTMQQTLKSFYKGSTHKIEGFYVGLIKKDGYSPDCMQGFIYDYLHKTCFNENLIYGFNGLIESFFSANHGSTKKYHDGEAVFEEWESENWPIISKVHDGALEFCKKMKPLIDLFEIKFDKIESYLELEQIMCKPRNVDIELFNKIVFFDTYYEPLICYSGVKNYILHPKKIISDLLSSNWKIGYLRKLLRLPFADKVYLVLNKVK